MRALVALALVAIPGFASAAEQPPAFPVFDLDGYCRSQARYSYAATLGDSSYVGVLQTCQDREGDAKVGASSIWPRVAPKVAAACIALADGKYSWLARCIDQSDRQVSRR